VLHFHPFSIFEKDNALKMTKYLFSLYVLLLASSTVYSQNPVALQLSPTCNIELKKFGMILPMPCDAVKDSSSQQMTFKKEYYLDGAMAGFVYITIRPNQNKTMDDIERVRGEMLKSYREQAEEFGLETTLSEVSRMRASSEMHLHLLARSFPKLEGNAQFKYLFWNDLLLGKDYTVLYEMLAPYNERVIHKLSEMVRLVEWLPVAYKDAKSGLSMMIPGGDWKAAANSTGMGVQLKPHYLWNNMYSNPKDRYPELDISPVPAYSAMGFDKAVAEIKSKMQQRGGVIADEEEIGLKNASKASFISAEFSGEGEFYSKEYIWLLQMPGNKFVELRMKATCDKYGCRGAYDVFPILEKVVASIKF
jgi:hypothetical protein